MAAQGNDEKNALQQAFETFNQQVKDELKNAISSLNRTEGLCGLIKPDPKPAAGAGAGAGAGAAVGARNDQNEAKLRQTIEQSIKQAEAAAANAQQILGQAILEHEKAESDSRNSCKQALVNLKKAVAKVKKTAEDCQNAYDTAKNPDVTVSSNPAPSTPSKIEKWELLDTPHIAKQAGFETEDNKGDTAAMKRSLMKTNLEPEQLEKLFNEISKNKKGCSKREIGEILGKKVYRYSFDSAETAQAFKDKVKQQGKLELYFPKQNKTSPSKHASTSSQPANAPAKSTSRPRTSSTSARHALLPRATSPTKRDSQTTRPRSMSSSPRLQP